MSSHPEFRPIILAGGSGTRFWPRSRKARAKQVLALDGERTMIQRTLDRLLPLSPARDAWVITNNLLSSTICFQLDEVPPEQVLCEPAARNTAPAAGLAAFLIEKSSPDAVLGVFPADHVIADEEQFLATLRRGIALAAAGENIVVLGVVPTRAETGYGYIETGSTLQTGIQGVRAVYGKAEPGEGRGVRCRRQLLLEQRNLSVERAHPRQCHARTSAGDFAAAGEDCCCLRHT